MLPLIFNFIYYIISLYFINNCMFSTKGLSRLEIWPNKNTLNSHRSFEGVIKFMNVAVNTKHIKLESSLMKHYLLQILFYVHNVLLKLNAIIIYVLLNLK